MTYRQERSHTWTTRKTSHTSTVVMRVQKVTQVQVTWWFVCKQNVHICQKKNVHPHSERNINATRSEEGNHNKEQTQQHAPERSKYARNVSYGDKMACADKHEVLDFLRSTRCKCKRNCLEKLYDMENGCTTVLSLRQQRFACTYVGPHRPKSIRSQLQCKKLSPGVKIIS